MGGAELIERVEVFPDSGPDERFVVLHGKDTMNTMTGAKLEVLAQCLVGVFDPSSMELDAGPVPLNHVIRFDWPDEGYVVVITAFGWDTEKKQAFVDFLSAVAFHAGWASRIKL